jgi:hypothetical protein
MSDLLLVVARLYVTPLCPSIQVHDPQAAYPRSLSTDLLDYNSLGTIHIYLSAVWLMCLTRPYVSSVR